MIVRIIDTSTGKTVADVPVVLQCLNYTPTELEYFANAWKCAVDDESVDPMRASNYAFQLFRN